jgi:exodeoxyribonuclease VII small subunit
MKPERNAAEGAETAPSEVVSFEAALSRLERLVHDLEEGNLSLEQSIRSFEEGMELVRRCASELRRIEAQVKVLTEEAGRILESDLPDPAPSSPPPPAQRGR